MELGPMISFLSASWAYVQGCWILTVSFREYIFLWFVGSKMIQASIFKVQCFFLATAKWLSECPVRTFSAVASFCWEHVCRNSQVEKLQAPKSCPNWKVETTITTGWWFQTCFKLGGWDIARLWFQMILFSPPWGNDTIWRAYFSNGLKLKPPPR